MATAFPFQQDSLVLQPSKAAWIPPLVIMLLVAAGGVWMIQVGAPAGWPVVALGAGGTAVALAQLVLNRTYVWLTVDGLTVGTLFGARHLSWSQVEWCDVTKQRVEIRYLTGRRIRRIAMMPAAYGMPPREMAGLFNQWRIRAARDVHSP